MKLGHNTKIDLIKGVPLFSSASKQELAEIASIADEIDLPEGKVLIAEGDSGREFFVLIEGTAQVERGGKKVADIGDGDFFGEISLISKTPRNATITTTSPVRALVITDRAFRQLLDHSPQIAVGVLSALAERLAPTTLYLTDDPEIEADQARAHELMERYNATRHGEQDERDRLLRELLGEVGEGVVIRPPFYCDYGTYISIGAGTFVNFDCVMLDVAPIRIGASCQVATCVQLLTATHPVDPGPRRAGWEYAKPITIGDNVWLGGGAIVCPGVTIGDDTVVGAGAVVTRDLPAGVVAVGNPARVQREIGERDRVDVPEL